MLDILTQRKPAPVFSAPKTPDVKRSRRWLDDRLARGRTEMFSEQTLVTPALAEMLLAINDGNRPISLKTVERYKAAIRDGRWVLTAQGISVARDGTLNDGQHRLQAIVDAGVATVMMVAFGEDPAAFHVLDTGRRRSPGDAASIAGYKQPNQQASVARLIHEIEAGRGRHKRPVDNDVVLGMLEARPEIHQAVKDASPIVRAFKAPMSGIGAATYFISIRHSKSARDPFVDAVSTGLNITRKHDPRMTLRTILTKREYAARDRGVYAAALMVKAWNAWRSKKHPKKIEWEAGEDFPLVL